MKPQNQNNKNDLFSGFDKRLKKKKIFIIWHPAAVFTCSDHIACWH